MNALEIALDVLGAYIGLILLAREYGIWPLRPGNTRTQPPWAMKAAGFALVIGCTWQLVERLL